MIFLFNQRSNNKQDFLRPKNIELADNARLTSDSLQIKSSEKEILKNLTNHYDAHAFQEVCMEKTGTHKDKRVPHSLESASKGAWFHCLTPPPVPLLDWGGGGRCPPFPMAALRCVY